MKYGVLSDIHANREALAAVLEEGRRREVARYLCLGDLVGYGADPEACLEMIRELGALTIRGNHDAAVADPGELDNFNPAARKAIIWTIPRLRPAEIAYLGGLPLVEAESGITLFHGSLDAPARWRYIFTAADARLSLERLPGFLGFFGHSHRPGGFRLRDGKVSFLSGSRIRIDPADRTLINPGSVGQPRDGDPRASWAVYDSDASRVEIVRVDYPVTETQEKIRSAGLPADLADRLTGGW